MQDPGELFLQDKWDLLKSVSLKEPCGGTFYFHNRQSKLFPTEIKHSKLSLWLAFHCKSFCFNNRILNYCATNTMLYFAFFNASFTEALKILYRPGSSWNCINFVSVCFPSSLLDMSELLSSHSCCCWIYSSFPTKCFFVIFIECFMKAGVSNNKMYISKFSSLESMDLPRRS